MATHAQSAGMDTKDRLLQAASREFAARGYKGASLRQICASAGVTTGALYFFFKNKEDLFRTVVEPVMRPLVEMLDTAAMAYIPSAGEASGEGAGAAAELPGPAREFLEMCLERRDIVKIMTRDRDNPVMELLVSEAASSLAECVWRGIEASGEDESARWDDFVVSWLSDLSVRSVIQVIGSHEDLEEACLHTRVILRFISAGVASLGTR